MRKNTRLSPHVRLQYPVPEQRSLGTRLGTRLERMLRSHSQSSLGMCPHHASSLERVSGSVKSSRHCSSVMGPEWVALDVGSFLQSCGRRGGKVEKRGKGSKRQKIGGYIDIERE